MKPSLYFRLIIAFLGASLSAHATLRLGSWVPLYQGVDHAMGTNAPGGGFPNPHVAYLVRVDLRDPDIRLFSSPRLEDYIPGVQETGGYTVSDFLAKHRLQVAINAGLFDPAEYYLPAGTPMDIHALSVCEGVVVSEQTSAAEAATIAFTADNVPTVIHTNWPAVSTTGIHTAVTGSYSLVVDGVNVGYQYSGASGHIHRTNPRTALGITQDQRYLYILTIDGRQPGTSTGALDYETAAWFLLVGAHNAINLDGGGSTTLVIEDSTGQPLRLNQSSAVADSGRERTVGNHFGVYAKPARGFINDLTAHPDDTTAVITWTTLTPATSQLRYGTNTSLALATVQDLSTVTNHSVALAGLKPGTTYYFAALSHDGTTEHVSPTRALITSNRVEQITLIEITHPWKFTTANLEGVPWTARSYDDSAWDGEGPGLLWVDTRGGPRNGVEPTNTSLPSDPSTGFPFPTYSFRTRFMLAEAPSGVALVFTNYLDDGAVFYLNGSEIHRLRMEDAPATIAYDALAVGFGCGGDATCSDVFRLEGDSIASLVQGENVLAVEVHNYNARSPDITFGLSLTAQVPIVTRPTLGIETSSNGLTLAWTGGGFVLQEATSPAGTWTDVPGPVVQSPYRTAATASPRFFRLRK